MDRRIAAIFVADMVGSSRLMERDERDIITRHKAHLAEVFEPNFSAQRGRVIKGTGDGLLGVFDSVVDALEAALKIQKAMALRELESERRIAYRIAIHLGDVMFDDDDVYGDGVNVASRLEAEAEAGGIVVSGAARDLLKGQVEVDYAPLGDLTVKGVSEPVRAFAIGGKSSKRRRIPLVKLTAAVSAVVTIGLAMAWWIVSPDFKKAEADKVLYSLPGEPVLAVSEFENISADPEIAYIGRSLMEQILVGLSDAPAVILIDARRVDTSSGEERVKFIAEATGARFVLLGSYLTKDGELQVATRLADALAGKQIWAETFREPLNTQSFFDLQRQIIEKLAIEINVELATGAQARPYLGRNVSLEDVKLGVEGEQAFQQWSAAGNGQAQSLYKQVLDKHPEDPGALTQMSWVYWQKMWLGIGDPRNAYRESRRFALSALEVDLEFTGAHAAMAWLALISRDFDAAEMHIDQHISTSNGHPAASAVGILLSLGRLQEAESIARQVMREQPRHHEFVPRLLAGSLTRQGRYEEAQGYLEGILASDVRDHTLKASVLLDLVALGALTGETQLSAKSADRFRREYPQMTWEKILSQIIIRDEEWRAGYVGALKEAGLDQL